MFHGARDLQICEYRHHHHHVTIMELGHLSICLGLTHPEVFSMVFSGSFQLEVCFFYYSR